MKTDGKTLTKKLINSVKHSLYDHELAKHMKRRRYVTEDSKTARSRKDRRESKVNLRAEK